MINHIVDASDEDIDDAVASARKAFKGAWADTSPYARGVILNTFADLLETHAEELAQLETLCSGKSINLSRGLEMAQSVVFLRYFAGWASKINGQTMSPSIPSMGGEQYMAYTLREPVGGCRDCAVELLGDDRHLEDRFGAGHRLHHRGQAQRIHAVDPVAGSRAGV